MAIRCTNCGQTLPTDDARFCNHCGTAVVSQSAPSQIKNELKELSISTQAGRSKPVLREQIAQQPPIRPASHGVGQKPSVQTGISPNHHYLASSNEIAEQGDHATAPALRAVSIPEDSRQEQRNPIVQDFVPSEQGEEDIEKIDTNVLALSNVVEEEDTRSERDLEDIEERETVQLPPQSVAAFSASASQLSFAGQEQREARSLASVQAVLPLQLRSSQRLPVVIVAVLLALLLVGGIGTWIGLTQPFSVPAITQPEQHFQDAGLGFSLQYPTGWQTQIERGKSTIHFSDSSHTAQVNIAVAENAGGDLAKYLQQQATQLGLTNGRSSTLTFAGVSWQAMQGSVVLDGANYTGALFATEHGGRVVTIIQLAPQNVYSDEEKLIFSSMRTSFRFSA